MEEEVHYSEVIFKNSGKRPRANNEEQVIYSEVKIKAPASQERTPAQAAVKGAVNTQHCKLLAPSVVTLGVLLLVTISLLIYFVAMNSKMSAENQGLIREKNVLEMKTEELSKQKSILENKTKELVEEKRILENKTKELVEEKSILENKTKELVEEKSILENKTKELVGEKSILENKTKELVGEKSILENKTDELSRQKDSLNWTMERIKMFKSFPVNDFCLPTGCQPCLTGWMEFQEKCYFFYNQSDGWKTWTESQTYCKENGADLVVIETLQEQEFISKNIHYYYDSYHGFWIGLKQEPGQNWTWVNGLENTLQFWVKEGLVSSKQYALTLPEKPPLASWNTSNNVFNLKFICESELMIKSF